MTGAPDGSNRLAHVLIVLGCAGLLASLVMIGRLVAEDRRASREDAHRFRDRLPLAGPVVKVSGNLEVPPFLLDETEVTVDAYRACVEQGACSAPSTGQFCNWGKPDRDDHPINCVDWVQAGAYCDWAGRRLPTQSEWSVAACGSDHRTYPWGDDLPSAQDCLDRGEKWEGLGGMAHIVATPLGTCPVREHVGRSAAGAIGMGGNVAEWTATEESGSAAISNRVVQAGLPWDWRYHPFAKTECDQSASYAPWYRSSLLGFRCARSVDEGVMIAGLR